MSAAPYSCQPSLLDSAGSNGGEEVNDTMQPALISVLDSKTAARLVVAEHYLHRRPPISHAFGIHVKGHLLGVVTYGTPASRHLQMGAGCSRNSVVGRPWTGTRSRRPSLRAPSAR